MLHAAGHARSLARVLAARRLVRCYCCRPASRPQVLVSPSASLPTTSTSYHQQQQRLVVVAAAAPIASSTRRPHLSVSASRNNSSNMRTSASSAATDAPPSSSSSSAAAAKTRRELAPAAPPLPLKNVEVPPLTLYDSMARAKRAFEPRAGGEPVSMYVCGVTVYDYSHVGHARVYCAADVLFRFLRRSGHAVRYVRNFTDIDDKIIARAKEGNENDENADEEFDVAAACSALTEKFIAEFHDDVDALRCLRPTAEPRATAFVPEMIEMIQDIVDAGKGYVAPLSGDVMFSVDESEGYGRLSGRTAADNRPGERVAVDSENKRNPADFVLWKSAKPGEPTWDSPWGPGRPGWHVECSAMARSLLGPVVDVHGGGADLMHPHHDNEIAQCQASAEAEEARRREGGSSSCGCCGGEESAAIASASVSSPSSSSSSPSEVVASSPKDFVRYWCHYGFVNVDAQKMSKSLGNFFTIRDARRRYSAPALRFFLLGTHYRSPLNFSHAALEGAADRLFYLYSTLADVDAELEALRERAKGEEQNASSSDASSDASPDASPAAPSPPRKKKGKAPPAAATSISEELSQAEQDLDAGEGPGGEALASALASLADDVGTPGAVAALSAPLKQANDLLATKAGKKAPRRAYSLASISAGVRAVLELLGLEPRPDASAALEELRDAALARAGVTRGDVDAGIAERAAARAAKDWAAADKVRERFEGLGIAISDTAGGGTTWRPVARSVGEEE